MRRRLLIGLLFTAGFVLSGSSVVRADDFIHKGGRGVVNVLTCWIEIPKQMQIGSQQDNPVTGIAMGIAKGVSNTVLRAGVGVYEAVSFALPYPKGYVSPYESMALPDYAWE